MSQLIKFETGTPRLPSIETVTGNLGPAVGPDGAGNVNLVGNGNISSTSIGAPPNTLEFSLVGTTFHAVQVGNAIGALNSIPVGLTGQVLTGVTNGDPVFAAPAASAITITGDDGNVLGPANAFTFSGGLTGLLFDGAATTETIRVTNFNMPNTNSAGTLGVITFGGNRFISKFGTSNTFVGVLSGNTSLASGANSGFGTQALINLTSGGQNSSFGAGSSLNLKSGQSNSIYGASAGLNIDIGSYNCFYGTQAGIGCTVGSESSNIILGADNVGSPGISNTLIIGNGTGAGIGNLNTTSISGIYNRPVGVTSGVVICDSTNILGSSNGANGQVLIGGGTGPVWANITAGANIAVTNTANGITIAANTGADIVNYTVVNFAASPYSAIATDYYISADVTGGAITIRLPNAATLGRVFVIKDKVGLAATNNITVTTVGGAVNIDGAVTFVMNTAYEAVQLIGNGVSYEVF